MRQYLILNKKTNKLIVKFETSSDQNALKFGFNYLLGLGLNRSVITKSFKIVEVSK